MTDDTSVALVRLKRLAIDHGDPKDIRAAILAHIAALTAENERLRKIIDGCDWYWPADDTSEDLCASCWQEAMEHGAYGEVWEVARGGIVERMWCAVLPPAPDAEDDDDFEICEDTADAAEAKLAAELERRARIDAATKES